MMKWLRATPPAIGSMWRFVGRLDNPFEDPACVVVAVKNGYVKYCWYFAKDDNKFRGDSRSIRDFRAMYREVTQ